jgi:diguanylate cyclase (GGDEF)-like protein/PAS domain S-box-containing protein
VTAAAGDDARSVAELEAEVERLRTVIRALMDRAERSTSAQTSDFGAFQAAVLLEEQVRRRTAELQAAVEQIEAINHALRVSEARFRGLVSQSMVGIAIFERGTFTYSNSKFDEIYGYTSDEIRTIDPLALVDPRDREHVAAYLGDDHTEATRVESTFRGMRKDGQIIYIECHARGLRVEGEVVMVGLVIDITKRVQAEREVRRLQERLREESTHDALTGLHNRRYMEEALEHALADARRCGQRVSVIMSDLDHFKSINDRFGHLGGDEILRAYGRLLRDSARRADVCCRYGGEEFLLVLPTMAGDEALRRAEEIRASIGSQAIPFGHTALSVTASFGVATFPDDGDTSDELLRAADRALYESKKQGRNRVTPATRQGEEIFAGSAHVGSR